MTTVNKLWRKAQKKKQRDADKKNRGHLVAQHNLTFDHQKVVEAEQANQFKIQQAGAWGSPFKGEVDIKAPSLGEMFMLPESKQSVVLPKGV
ncbi:hypothetical protein ST201phi2-1p050 [Pseudomonas phage 201phi2-1]|uniref:Uncharacterized protein n=1 Tax=Pseudomonas phage 201phi2-1 TaxID=198110 RepID=B3FK25_BP201|nr:hypothetical protein ST201phi2-1p050 [Pseudomonas phage 201phi2-1]ABY62883.1 hypothetical protein 201phi2-1p050 [Pseudomonas phage 201phi2-1]